MIRKEFRALLESQTKSVAGLLSARSAARVYPIASHFKTPLEASDQLETIEHLTLVTGRAVLSSFVGAKTPSVEIVAAAKAASHCAEEAGPYPLHYIASSAKFAAAHAACCAPSYAASEAARDAAARAGFAATAYWAKTEHNAINQDLELDFDALLSTPIWHDVQAPKWLNEFLEDQQNILDSGPEWAFWQRWYYSLLKGETLDWELQRRVALIGEEIWETGPKPVAAEIARIEAALKVERAAGELKVSAAKALSSRRGIGDNHPPSPIDDALSSNDGTTIIWAAAQELKAEAQASAPHKGKVLWAVSAIVGVMKACGLYVSKKVDIGLNATIVSACSAAGVAGVAWVTANVDKLNELIEAISRWLPFLG